MRFTGLFKPEYLYRPGQIVRRLRYALAGKSAGQVTVPLPWGWPVTVWKNESLGNLLIHLGVYDLAVSETLWRLSDPGETALDLGANVGVLTAALARRAGPTGRVLAFEALPKIAAELRANVEMWRDLSDASPIEIHEVALSYREGEITFEIPYYFDSNHGVGYVNEGETRQSIPGQQVVVPCSTLDKLLAAIHRVGVAKMDVEGHEAEVIAGGKGILERGVVRDWIFEHLELGRSHVTDRFEACGYSIFQIRKTFRRVELIPLASAVNKKTWEIPSYLATRDSGRAIDRMSKPGWQVLASE
jgi:FkbM family methyltransferase